jgi:hypothetical protein
MKTFLDLLATKQQLEIQVNGVKSSKDLLDDLEFRVDDQVQVDGIEVLPKYHYLSKDGVLGIPGPFYGWLHTASGQGWLLKPIKDELPNRHVPNETT